MEAIQFVVTSSVSNNELEQMSARFLQLTPFSDRIRWITDKSDMAHQTCQHVLDDISDLKCVVVLQKAGQTRCKSSNDSCHGRYADQHIQRSSVFLVRELTKWIERCPCSFRGVAHGKDSFASRILSVAHDFVCRIRWT